MQDRPAAPYDIFVIGGGVNGCGIARDAAGRGHSVFLAEMGDLAGATSSGSTKLIHGGLRYLEHRAFGLVRQSLRERETLWRIAPHIVRPMRFVLPHHRGLRPAWMLRLGLFLYDHIGGRRLLPGTITLDLRRDPAGKPLKPVFRRGFEYSDCRVDDARLVVLNARDAADRGAAIATRTRVVAARARHGGWTVTVEDGRSRREVEARLLVNAAGPWAAQILSGVLQRNDAGRLRLVKGSHIVIGKKFEGERAYVFQNADGRVFFAIPFETDFTLIGTTDQEFSGDPADARISEEETRYLIAAAGEYFAEPVAREDIVHTFAAVRALTDDGTASAKDATRDYLLQVEGGDGSAPLVNVFGGKITTYRRLAEAAMERIEPLIGAKGRPWTAKAPLPGGDFAPDGLEAQAARLEEEFPFLGSALARRLTRLYGTLARDVPARAGSIAELGRRFGADFYEAELRYLMEREWARTAEDVLWRRTKLGLKFTAEETAALDAHMAALAEA